MVSVSQELGVSRQTVHKWLARYKRFGTSGLVPGVRKKRVTGAKNRTSEEVETLVQNIAQAYWQDGVETLHDRLECEHNISLHPTTIYRIKTNAIEFRNNTPYCPEENGKIERFHRTLNEKGLRYGFSGTDSLEAMQYRLNLFLHYCNFQKKHRGLGMDGKTPMERLRELTSVNLTVQWYIF